MAARSGDGVAGAALGAGDAPPVRWGGRGDGGVAGKAAGAWPATGCAAGAGRAMGAAAPAGVAVGAVEVGTATGALAGTAT